MTDAKIRICHVQVLPILSGVQRAMLEIFKHLDPARYEIHVACQGAGPLTAELERQGIRWHAVPTLGRAIRPGKDWLAYNDLYRLFRQHQFQIVHTHSSKPGILGRIAARRAGVPNVIHHVQGFAFHEFSSPAKRWFYSRLERWAGNYCDRVVFVNHEERELSVRQGWLPAEKCLTVYNGIDLDEITPTVRQAARSHYRAQWRIADDEVAIVFAGRLEPQKQPLALADIAHALRQYETATPWRLVVVGEGPLAGALQSRLRTFGLDDHVSMVGWQDAPRAALAVADVVLLPSLFEGLSVALIEAQAAGLPIVASNVKGNREVVVPETGFLCPPTDTAAYVRSLARLVDNPLSRAKLGQAARRHAESAFDGAANHCQVANLYDELLQYSPVDPAHVHAA